jgi:chemotaxis protein MotA
MFSVMNELTRMVRRDGVLALEPVIAGGSTHPLMQKYPKFGNNKHAVHFLAEGLTILAEGNSDPHKMSEALEQEMKVIEREHHAAVGVLQRTADALPGFGIVAAVLGIVITMEAIDGPASEIGHKVGAALVGTFLGILLSYGFFAPLAGRMELLGEAESTFFKSMTSALVSMNQGENARDVVNKARRIVGTDVRPNQADMDEIFKGAGTSA